MRFWFGHANDECQDEGAELSHSMDPTVQFLWERRRGGLATGRLQSWAVTLLENGVESEAVCRLAAEGDFHWQQEQAWCLKRCTIWGMRNSKTIPRSCVLMSRKAFVISSTGTSKAGILSVAAASCFVKPKASLGRLPGRHGRWPVDRRGSRRAGRSGWLGYAGSRCWLRELTLCGSRLA